MYAHLKELRESLKMTQEDFGKSVGVAKSTYNNYEKGIREPKSDFWIAVAEKYDVTIDYLMGFSDDPHGYVQAAANEPISEDELQKRLDQLVNEINRQNRFLETAADYTYNFFLKMRALVGSDKQTPHDIFFRSNKEIVEIQDEIEELIVRFMETAAPQEKLDFLSRLDQIGAEFHQQMDSIKPYNHQHPQVPPEDKN